jgi:hypothetical protein
MRIAAFVIPILTGLVLSGPAAAESADLEYDIYLVNDTLAVWLDLRPVLDQSKMEDLLAGLDLWLAVELKIEKPRKLFFSKTISSYGPENISSSDRRQISAEVLPYRSIDPKF